MNQLNTILPPSLRALCRGYYSNEQRANRFVVINTLGTGFEVRMGSWTSTSDPKQDIRNKALITLYKDTGDKECNLRFDQDSVNVLRQDEFEWLLRESVAFMTYDDMVECATLGNTAAITIYLYLLELAKPFHLEPVTIFGFIDKFRFKYDPDRLMKIPW